MDTLIHPKNTETNTPNIPSNAAVAQFQARIAEHPNLIPLMSEMLDLVDDLLEGTPDAHQVENQTVLLTRKIGSAVLGEWSQKAHDRARDEVCRLNGELIVHKKSRFTWHSRFGVIELKETVLREGRRGTKQWRPFRERAGISCRGLALGLERVAVDFSADQAFGKASAKLEMHYGIELDRSRLRTLTLQHGKACADHMLPVAPADKDKPEQLVAELDGTMIPLVTTGQGGEGADARKDRDLHWGEARLAVVCVPGKVDAVHGAVLGDRFEAGLLWQQTAAAAGYTSGQTKVHGVGDGASWIKEEFDTAFGSDGNYILDYWHVREYLDATATLCSPQSPEEWITEQKTNLLEGRQGQVIDVLKAHCSPLQLSGPDKPPVDRAHDYLEARLAQLDYASARAAGLPIGSGAVEGKHRSVIHERLKIPGAWWLKENARKMLNLRTLRANEGCWDTYWTSLN